MIQTLAWLASIAGLYAFFMLVWFTFVGLMAIKRVKREGNLGKFAAINASVFLVLGGVGDVVFNLICGTIMFVELPHELLFTNRVQRHERENGTHYDEEALRFLPNTPTSWRGRLAHWWCQRMLNPFDPGHC